MAIAQAIQGFKMTSAEAFDVTQQVKKANMNLLLFLLGQFIAIIVWGAGISKDVQWIKANVDELRSNRYSSIDAAKDSSALHTQMDKLEARIAEIEKRR